MYYGDDFLKLPCSQYKVDQKILFYTSKLPRRTYLVTYSQVDLTKFSTRKEF